MLVATFRWDVPARCSAFADERRIVAGDAGCRTGTTHPVFAGSAARQTAPPTSQAPLFDSVREARSNG